MGGHEEGQAPAATHYFRFTTGSLQFYSRFTPALLQLYSSFTSALLPFDIHRFASRLILLYTHSPLTRGTGPAIPKLVKK